MTDRKSFEQLVTKQAAVLTAALIHALNENALLAWDRADGNDHSAGFSADLVLAISVQQEGEGFTTTIMFQPDALPLLERTEDGGANLYMPEEITLPIDADLYAEIEKSFRQRA